MSLVIDKNNLPFFSLPITLGTDEGVHIQVKPIDEDATKMNYKSQTLRQNNA